MKLTVLGPETRSYGEIAVIAVKREDGTYVGGMQCGNKYLAHDVLPEVRQLLRDAAADMIRQERSKR